MSASRFFIAVLVGVGFWLPARAADDTASIRTDTRALASLQALVGQWKGVGQPKRGSNQGAWTEELERSWKFDRGRAALVAELTHDKYFAQLRLQAGDTSDEFVLVAAPVAEPNSAASSSRRFVGGRSGKDWVLTSDAPAAGRPERITLRLVAGGDRLLILYERRLSGDVFGRLAEVGATRRGGSIAPASVGGPECVVTGGLGKIPVEHNGRTYYVCCTGCRDLFREDPEGVLADYRQRKAAEQGDKGK